METVAICCAAVGECYVAGGGRLPAAVAFATAASRTTGEGKTVGFCLREPPPATAVVFDKNKQRTDSIAFFKAAVGSEVMNFCLKNR